MPQIGHAPGPARLISGCIGQVYIVPSGTDLSDGAALATLAVIAISLALMISAAAWSDAGGFRRAHGLKLRLA
jgi:hypothetical protein